MNPIYLDNNATTPLDPRVLRAMIGSYEANFANSASPHREGQRAGRRLNELRDSILNRLKAATKGSSIDRLIFTSGGTESNNLAVIGLSMAARRIDSEKNRVVVSSIEHPSISEAATKLGSLGFKNETINTDGNGVVSIDHLKELLEQPAALVSMICVNNETGVIQPVDEAAKLCADAGVSFHTDAVQAVGKVPCRFGSMQLTALSLTAHKLHGPRGIGGLIVKADAEIDPILFGGFQQLGSRPGTEDVALATGFATAIELAFDELDERVDYVRGLRDSFEQLMLEEFNDSIRIFGFDVPRAPHTSNISFVGKDRQAIVLAADMVGVCCSTGSACASGSSEPSPVLLAMGRSQAEVRGAVRFSFSSHLSGEDVRLAGTKIADVVKRMRN